MSENTVVDYLEEDKPIKGQNFCVLSFLSPEKVLKKKEAFFFSEFMKWVCTDSDFVQNAVLKEVERVKGADGKEVEREASHLDYNMMKSKYDDFMYLMNEKLEAQFHEQEEFRTTVRGVKVRGVYDTQREAQIRCQVLQKMYKHDNIFVGQVGYWLPWDPEADNVENVEYAEPELNRLMKEYKLNAHKRDVYYQERKQSEMEEQMKKELEGEKDPWLKRKEEEANADKEKSE